MARSRHRLLRVLSLSTAAILALTLATFADAAPGNLPADGGATPANPAADKANGKSAANEAQPAASDDALPGSGSEALYSAVVRVNARAVKDARSAQSLGTQREGSGVLIDRDGLVLTIGYLIIEADEVTLTDRDGKSKPATVVGYDHASGLGLVKSLVPLAASPVPFGDSQSLAEGAMVQVVNHGGKAESTPAYVVSRRQFTGNWEYLVERAIFISPPVLNWSGAALVDKAGKLLGIGSLIVRQVAAEVPVPGNMFVPIDLLEPILDDLVKHGRRGGPARPWLGVAADEVQGRLFVTRVSPGGPAERAGMQQGDIIVGVGSEPVHSQGELYRRVWARGGAGVEIELNVLQGTEVRKITLRSIDRSDYFRPKPTL